MTDRDRAGLLLAASLGVLAILWYLWFAKQMEQDMRAFLQVYALYQEAEHANHGTYANTVGNGQLRIPRGLEILVVSSSRSSHAAVTRPRYGYPRMYCALWVGPMPTQLQPPVPDGSAPDDKTWCDKPARFERWLDATRDGRLSPTAVAQNPSPPAEIVESPRPVLADASACAVEPADTPDATSRRVVPPRMVGGGAGLTVDRPLRYTVSTRPTGPFRATRISLEPDTLWFTESRFLSCPTEAIAFVRATGEWVTTVRGQCEAVATESMEVPAELSLGAVGGHVPNPDQGSPPRQIEETVYSDPAFQDSVPLVNGLWLELRVTPIADSMRTDTAYRDGRRVEVTSEAHYALHLPGDSAAIPLRVSDEQWQAAAARWDPPDRTAVTPSTRVTHWLMAGNSLFAGLSRDLLPYWSDFAVRYELRRAGAILHVDLTTREVTPVLHPMLADWLPQQIYVQGGALWDLGHYSGYEESADIHPEARWYRGFEPNVRRIFRWSFDGMGCEGFRVPRAAVVGDSVWLAYADRVTLIDFGSGTESTLYYRDSTFALPDGADTLVTVLSASGPGAPPPTPPSITHNPPTTDREYGRWMAQGIRVRRMTAFIDAYLTLPDSARSAIRDYWEICALAEGGCENPFPTVLAHDELVPFLPEAWRYVRGRSAWYDGVIGALESVGGDYLEAALRTALDSAPIDRAAHSASLLLERGDSTGVAWLHRALRDPRRIADTSRLRHSELSALDHVVNLASRLRDAESMPAIIDLLDTPHWQSAPVEALVSLTGLETAPKLAAGQTAVSAFWRGWWAEHGAQFEPVTREVGREAVRAWRP